MGYWGLMSDSPLPVLPVTCVQSLTRIRRKRTLASPGQVTASVGSYVDPLNVVARANSSTHLMAVPVARYLHVPEAKLSDHLLKKPGEAVYSREIIASKPELFGTLQRIYRAPSAGYIAAVQGSWVAIGLADSARELKALYRGSVVDVTPGLGVTIESVGSLAQGVWGAGGEAFGVLKKMVDAPDVVLTEDKVDVSVHGSVLLLGAGLTEQALERIAKDQAAGLVAGSLSAHLQARIAEFRIPTVITDGFGELPMAAPVFELLASHVGEEISVNATMGTRRGTDRPEVFIPAVTSSASAAGIVAAPVPETCVGATVRILCAPHANEIGKIDALPNLPQNLESGISAWGAEIELAGGEGVFVPWENLELVG